MTDPCLLASSVALAWMLITAVRPPSTQLNFYCRGRRRRRGYPVRLQLGEMGGEGENKAEDLNTTVWPTFLPKENNRNFFHSFLSSPLTLYLYNLFMVANPRPEKRKRPKAEPCFFSLLLLQRRLRRRRRRRQPSIGGCGRVGFGRKKGWLAAAAAAAAAWEGGSREKENCYPSCV